MRAQYAAFVLSILLSGCGQKPGDCPIATDPAIEPTAATESAARSDIDLQILDFQGIEQLVASHRGQVVVMDAWSTSCAPCVKEFPKLVALQAKHKPQQLACISLSFDYEGIGTPEQQAPKVRKFLERQNATFENVLSSDDSDVLRAQFHLASVPAVFVYDKSGRLRKRFDNEQAMREADAFTYEQVGDLVAELLDEDLENETSGAAPTR